MLHYFRIWAGFTAFLFIMSAIAALIGMGVLAMFTWTAPTPAAWFVFRLVLGVLAIICAVVGAFHAYESSQPQGSFDIYD